jgi:hypothetical protein
MTFYGPSYPGADTWKLSNGSLSRVALVRLLLKYDPSLSTITHHISFDTTQPNTLFSSITSHQFFQTKHPISSPTFMMESRGRRGFPSPFSLTPSALVCPPPATVELAGVTTHPGKYRTIA